MATRVKTRVRVKIAHTIYNVITKYMQCYIFVNIVY